ncbi:MAG: choloylglycine hydrolase family protein [Chlamydiales bacterium]
MNSRVALFCFFVFLFIHAKASACTGILLKTQDGSIVHGRTVEFGVFIDTSVAVIPRNYEFVGSTPMGPGKKYTSRYAALGIFTYDNVKLMDGINEAGLALGAFYFPTFAEYSHVTSENVEKALSPIDFSNWILTQFSSLDEIRKAIEKESVLIVPTVIEGWGSETPPFHYIVYDKKGKSIVIEPLDGKLVVKDNPIGVLTNSPSFDWHLTNIRNYIALNPRNVPPIKIDGTQFASLGQGSGMLGLPGDFTPPSRFVRATVFSASAIPEKTADQGILQTFHILNNFDIPIGVARHVEDGVIHSDYTMLTVARDPQSLKYYYKTYDDQTIRYVDLSQFDLNAKQIKFLSTKSSQPLVNMTEMLRGKHSK